MLILGFDGGGSNARLKIATEAGETVFQAVAGGVNPMDNENWRDNFQKLFMQVSDKRPLLKAGVFGLPGWGEVPHFDDQVRKWLGENLHCPVLLLNDVELAQRAAFTDGPGILLLSGTGSMAVGRAANGSFLRAGGFGDLIGDEGSAYDIGRHALVRLTHELDGRSPETAFGHHLIDHLRLTGKDTVQALLTWLYEQKHARSAIASIAALVDQVAESGDPYANELLNRASAALVNHYCALVLRMGQRYLPWSYAGSTFKSTTFRNAIELLIGHPPTPPANDALTGALQIAAKMSSGTNV